MKGNITLAIIKPWAVHQGYIVPILDKMHEAEFKISAMKLLQLSKQQAVSFYAIHKDKPFFDHLTDFMASDRIVVILLEKENAVADFRKLIGATDPSESSKGTIRNLYAKSKEKNAVHGSDSDENAIIEGDFFFSRIERF